MNPFAAARTEHGPAAHDGAPAFIRGATPDPSAIGKPGPWQLVLMVALPFWAYLAISRVVVFQLINAGNPGMIIAPPHLRLLQHALLLPLLLLFYRWGLAIGWSSRARVRGVLIHMSMAVLFALLARPILLVLVAAERGEWHLMGELIHSAFGVRLSVDLWITSFSDFLLSYVLGLAILLGVKNYRELKYTQLRAANLHAAWTQSRLQALRMQLNPHFLFNTLNAAVALVSSRPKAAEQMLIRLADLLRRTLRDGETDFITVAREADFVRNYLEVQRLRFPDRLTFTLDVDPNVLDAAVPSLLLQPLAENAVIHSVSAESANVLVDVRVRRVVQGLELTVRNSVARPRRSERVGVGLNNTRERLRTLFEANYELELIHSEDGSVLARVRIPYIESGEREAA
jgi:hypothetical protein